MTQGTIIALILSLALENGIDGRLALSIIEQENSRYDYLAVHQNANGSQDLGIMQLNSRSIPDFIRWYWRMDHEFDWRNPEDNIRLGLMRLKALLDIPHLNDWQAIICYNAGTGWYMDGRDPPNSAIEYANAVYVNWKSREYDRR